ncbi:MAG: YicC/YloC family endoribonuclease [Pseudoruegeria sp.]
MVNSMTGYASGTGSSDGFSWTWDLRSVNARGLDIRLRTPDWVVGLDQTLRGRLSKALGRGSVSIGLKLVREDVGQNLTINISQLGHILTALDQIESTAADLNYGLRAPTAADILSMRGVTETTAQDVDPGPIKKTLEEDFESVLATFLESRASEGQSLDAVLTKQVDDIEQLTKAAEATLESRAKDMAQSLNNNLKKVLEASEGIDENRVAQELALISVKTDVTEELDRLKAHVSAARTLIDSRGPVGRKLDFLTQEFNREANTLCSKAQFNELTTIGLDLKAVIDQMREQVQNVE